MRGYQITVTPDRCSLPSGLESGFVMYVVRMRDPLAPELELEDLYLGKVEPRPASSYPPRSIRRLHSNTKI